MLKTKRIILKKITRKDIPQLVNIAKDNEIIKFSDHLPFPLTVKEAQNLINVKRDSIQLGIFIKNKKLIGVIELYKIKEHNRAKIGYWIGKKYRNKGYASESIEKIINYAFKKLKLKVLFARIRIDNKYSIKLMNKFGFKQTEDFQEDGKNYFRWQLKSLQ